MCWRSFFIFTWRVWQQQIDESLFSKSQQQAYGSLRQHVVASGQTPTVIFNEGTNFSCRVATCPTCEVEREREQLSEDGWGQPWILQSCWSRQWPLSVMFWHFHLLCNFLKGTKEVRVAERRLCRQICRKNPVLLFQNHTAIKKQF